MIGQAQFVNGVWMGIVLIALGLLPVLLQSLSDSLRKFMGTITPAAIPTRLRNQTQRVPLKQQPWLAALGVGIIAASFVLYLTT